MWFELRWLKLGSNCRILGILWQYIGFRNGSWVVDCKNLGKFLHSIFTVSGMALIYVVTVKLLHKYFHMWCIYYANYYYIKEPRVRQITLCEDCLWVLCVLGWCPVEGSFTNVTLIGEFLQEDQRREISRCRVLSQDRIWGKFSK